MKQQLAITVGTNRLEVAFYTKEGVHLVPQYLDLDEETFVQSLHESRAAIHRGAPSEAVEIAFDGVAYSFTAGDLIKSYEDGDNLIAR